MSTGRLDELLQRYIDVCLTDAERAELENELLASAEARQAFWRHLQLEGQIQEVIDTQQVRQWMSEHAPHPTGALPPASLEAAPRKRLTWGLAGLAASVVAMFLVWDRPSRAEGTSEGVAILTGVTDVRWAPGQLALEPGTILAPGRLRITAGLVGLEFYSGARMTLQGPAEVELSRVDQVFCEHGKMRIQVTDRARGFRVLSPRLELVDFGADFGLEIGPQGITDVHVFHGSVEITRLNSANSAPVPRELAAGQGLRMNGAGVAKIPVQPAHFAGHLELNALVLKQTRTRYAAWREASLALRQDPRLILYYDFEPTNRSERILGNHSAVHGDSLDGTVVGATWTEGRWSGKTALEFREPGDRVRTLVPGEYDALTFVTWLHVDAFNTIFSGIFLTDGFVKGAAHWQFYEGHLRLGLAGNINARGKIGTEYDVETIEPEAILGRWRQLALVVDNTKREVVHYIDGRAVKRDPILKPNRLSLGKAELGNWGLPDNSGSVPIRNFNGRMDEFMVFSQALTDAEIATLYEQGRPWPNTVARAVRLSPVREDLRFAYPSATRTSPAN